MPRMTTRIEDRVPKTILLGVYLLLWYVFNGAFSVSNKRLLSRFPFPWVLSWIHLATGIVFFVPAWTLGIRAAPRLDRGLLIRFAPIAALHASGHALQVASMGAGSVYFTTIIKATEPLVGTLVVLIFTGKIAPWYVNACLIPVVAGVAYASSKSGDILDMSDLSSFAAGAAFASTVFFAIAKLLAKQLMTKVLKQERNLDAANIFSVLTSCSTALLLLPSLLAQGAPASGAVLASPQPGALFCDLFVCGFHYYSYNELGFRVLDALGPVSQAVANSAKRVVVLLAAVLMLGETASGRELVGAAIAIAGVTFYSLAKLLSTEHASGKTV